MVVDAVGGEMLARLLGQLKYGASVAVVGNASGTAVPANVIPFLLRGINMPKNFDCYQKSMELIF